MNLIQIELTEGVPALPENGWIQSPPDLGLPSTGFSPYVFIIPFRGIVPAGAVRIRPDGTREVRMCSLIQVLEDGRGSSNSGRLVYTDKPMPIIIITTNPIELKTASETILLKKKKAKKKTTAKSKKIV